MYGELTVLETLGSRLEEAWLEERRRVREERVDELLASAGRHSEAGEPEQAAEVLREVLSIAPEHGEAKRTHSLFASRVTTGTGEDSNYVRTPGY